MKKIIIVVVSLFFFLNTSVVLAVSAKNDRADRVNTDTVKQEVFVGSVKSNKYHSPDCYSVKRIIEMNLIEFYSKSEAESKGYQPCRRCLKETG